MAGQVWRELLTEDEHEAMRLSGELANKLGKIIGNGSTRQHDLAEMVNHVHVVQQMILAQAAGRAYPDRYRLMGETIRDPAPEDSG